MATFDLHIEKNPDLLKKYGLAMGLLSNAEYLTGEMVRLFSGLHTANQDVVDELMENKTFGSVVSMARKIGTPKALLDILDPLVADRNSLAHGIAAEQEGVLKLMHKKKLQDLDDAFLDGIIEHGRTACYEILKYIYATFPPVKDPPANALSTGEGR